MRDLWSAEEELGNLDLLGSGKQAQSQEKGQLMEPGMFVFICLFPLFR